MQKAVLFDLDGTLLNTLGDLTAAVNHGLTAHGFPTHTEAEVRTYVGDGVKKLIARACPPTATDADREAVQAAYLSYYAAHNTDRTVPYDGVMQLLVALKEKGYRLAVVSNKHEAGVQDLCRRFFGDYLSLAVGGNGERPLKPAPDGLQYALSQLEVAPEGAWYVGDSAGDVLAAHAAGARSIAVCWGFQDRDRLVAQNPTALVETPDQVLKTVLNTAEIR